MSTTHEPQASSVHAFKFSSLSFPFVRFVRSRFNWININPGLTVVLDSTFVPVVSLIGGVGSGKSSLTHWLSQRHNLVVIDGDRIGHEILHQPSIKDRLRQHFHNSIFDDQGNVIRAALAREVFGSTPRHQQMRTNLESIVHPEIRHVIETRIKEARAEQSIDIIMLDAAVLLEAGWQDLCDLVVFVEVPERQRLERVAQTRGWSAGELKSRESSQLPLELKRQAAKVVIDNSRSIDEAGIELEQSILQFQKEHSQQDTLE